MRAHRSASALLLFAALALAPHAGRAGNIPLEEPPPSRSSASSGLHIAWVALMYLPNRIFDLTDIVRLQVRAGPGWALGARATRAFPVFLGDYKATWIGLPGPRGRASIPLPVGLESQQGVSFGPALASGSQAPHYGTGEFGAGVHIYVLGVDAGFDVVELADFFAGFACVDFAHDDF
jgi:hypothetical protein